MDVVMTEGRARARMLRPEDVALAAWNLVAVPVGAAVAGGWSSGQPAPAIGLLQLAGLFGVVIALATRTPGASPLVPDGFRAWVLAGPLVGAVGIVGADTSDRLGLDLAEVMAPVALVATIAAFTLGHRLPVLDERWRRLLVAPFVFVCAGFFDSFVADLLDGLDLPGIARAAFGGSASDPQTAALGGIVLFGVLAGSAVFYAMLVLAPRELAAPEPRPAVWLVRFAVFAVSAFVGAGAWALI
jgi:hypothetical protein